MNYIDIVEAAKITGKSEKTIRRLLSKEESKSFIDKKEGKLFVNVNYLFASYPAIKINDKPNRHSLNKGQNLAIDSEIISLENKLAIFQQELKHKQELLQLNEQIIADKNSRIEDLQKSLLMLGAPKEESSKKKSWWQFKHQIL